MFVYVLAYIYTCIHKYILYSYIRIYVHTCMYIYIVTLNNLS